MAENEPLCRKQKRNWPQLDKCLSKKAIIQTATALMKTNKNFCEQTFANDDASRYMCLYVTQNSTAQLMKERCLNLNFV